MLCLTWIGANVLLLPHDRLGQVPWPAFDTPSRLYAERAVFSVAPDAQTVVLHGGSQQVWRASERTWRPFFLYEWRGETALAHALGQHSSALDLDGLRGSALVRRTLGFAPTGELRVGSQILFALADSGSTILALYSVLGGPRSFSRIDLRRPSEGRVLVSDEALVSSSPAWVHAVDGRFWVDLGREATLLRDSQGTVTQSWPPIKREAGAYAYHHESRTLALLTASGDGLVLHQWNFKDAPLRRRTWRFPTRGFKDTDPSLLQFLRNGDLIAGVVPALRNGIDPSVARTLLWTRANGKWTRVSERPLRGVSWDGKLLLLGGGPGASMTLVRLRESSPNLRART